MTFREILDALIAGERLRSPDWCDKFVMLDSGGNLVDNEGNLEDELEGDYEIVPAPLSFCDALAEVTAGKRVKRDGWVAGREIYLGTGATPQVLEAPSGMPFVLTSADATAEDYSIVEP